MKESKENTSSEKLLTVVVPAFNEAENLKGYVPELIEYTSARGWDLVIVNDGSMDKTKKILNQYTHDNFTVVHHKVNRGYGGAIISGILAARTKYLITIDADGQHVLEDIDKLLQVAIKKDADMVVGSRKGQKSASLLRAFGKLLIRNLARLLMPLKIHDINSGMKLYDTQIAKQYLHLLPTSMAFSDIVALVFINNRHLVMEVPIQINDRTTGNSTIGIHTAFHTVMEILNIVTLFHPMKVFLPVSMIGFFGGMGWGIRGWVMTKEISVVANLLIVSSILTFLLGLVAEQLSEIRKNLLK